MPTNAPVPAATVMPPETGIAPEFLPDESKMITEDDTPVDGIFSEKQMRLLTEPLYSSWSGPGGNRPFLALANVGLYYAANQPAVVPDVFLSVDVQAPEDPFPKKYRSYFMWLYGKSPEVAIEVVSNREGEEDGKKMSLYANIGIPYYVIWDPENLLKGGPLRVFELSTRMYRPKEDLWFPLVNLGLKCWHGEYEQLSGDWLRWCDPQGNLIATGRESAELAIQRAERLAAQLRALGVEPKNGDNK